MTLSRNAAKQHHGFASSKEDAKRFGICGMLLGAVAGVQGGITMAASLAVAGGVVGAGIGFFAGRKIASAIQKRGSTRHPREEKKEKAVVHLTVVSDTTRAKSNRASLKDVGEIDPQVLAELKEQVAQAIIEVKADVQRAVSDPRSEDTWMDVPADKRPTHPTHTTYQ